MEAKNLSGEFKEQEICDLSNGLRNPEVYQLSINASCFMYLPYQQNVIKLTEDEKKIFLSNETPKKDILKEFLKVGLYVDKNLVVTKDPISKYSENNSISPDSLVLLLTTCCNKRCKYCYIEAGNFEPLSIDVDAVKFVLDKYRPKDVLFFGMGEPTIRLDFMQNIVDLSKGRGINFSLITNGEYYPKKRMEQITKFIWNNQLKVILSWDGPPEIHNLQRPSKRGLDKKPSNLLEETVKELSKYGNIDKFCNPRATISRFSQNKLDDIVDYFLSFGFHNCALEQLAPLGRSVDYPNEPEAQPPNLRILAEQMLKSRPRAKRKGMNLKNSLFQYETPGMYPCASISLRSLVVGPTKRGVTYLSSCYHFQEKDSPFRIGTITKVRDTFVEELDYNKINKLQYRNSYSIKECRTCLIKCGGGCTSLAGQIKEEKEDFSQAIYKENCNAKRWMLAQRIKYLFRDK